MDSRSVRDTGTTRLTASGRSALSMVSISVYARRKPNFSRYASALPGSTSQQPASTVSARSAAYFRKDGP